MYKRIRLLIVCLVFMLAFSVGYAAESLLYTANLTTDAQAVTGKTNFYGLWIVTDGSNDVTFSVYDGTSTAGALLFPTTVIAAADATTQTISFDPPIICTDGVYIDITTAGTVTYKAYYNKVPF